MRRVLALSDTAVVVLAVAACALIEGLTSFQASTQNPVLLLPAAVAVWVGLAGMGGMYHVDDRRIDCSSSEEIFRVIQLVGIWL